MKNLVKKIVFAACAIVATSAFSATYNQASQAWVNMKLQELDEKLTAQIQNISYNVLTITNVVEYTNALNQTINNMNATSAASFSGIDFMPSLSSSNVGGRQPYYVVFGLSDAFTIYVGDYNNAFTNSFHVGTIIDKVSDSAYSTKDGKVAVTNFATYSVMYVNYSPSRSPLLLYCNEGEKDFVYGEDQYNKVTAYILGSDNE